MALESALRSALACTFVMRWHAQFAHWNVRGPGFSANHAFLGELYEDLDDATDMLAEELRALGVDAPTSLAGITADAMIPDVPVGSIMSSILALLAAENRTLIECLTTATDEANAIDRQGLVNALADRLDRHAKWGWMIEAGR